MSNSSLAGLFNPQSVVEQPSARNLDEYKVNFKDGKGGIYDAVVRFIPNVADPSKCIMAKQISWVKNPVTQKGMYVDDPRSVGQFSPIVDMFFKCRNTNNAQIQEFGKAHLSTKQQYAALVQIIKDDNHPENVGKIKVFRFGKKLWDKLHNEEHPTVGQGYNPFHPIYGRYFHIRCVSQSGFNNFDQSSFIDNRNAQGVSMTGFYYEDPSMPGQLQPVTENSNQQAVADYLAANSPDLSKYDYQPWTADQQAFVDEVLAIISNYLQGGGNLQTNLQTINTPSTGVAAMPMNTAPTFPGASIPAPQVAPAMPTMSIPVQQPAVATPTPTPNMGGFSLGESTIPGINPAPAAAPSISGIELPSVDMPTNSNVGFANPGMGIGGNLDDVIAQL
jgi:hypothetical protein